VSAQTATVSIDFAAYVEERRRREAASGLDPDAYAHPSDRRARRLLAHLGPLRGAFDASVRAARETLSDLLGPSGVPLGEGGTGALRDLLDACAHSFGLGRVPAYLSEAAGPQGAATLGTAEAPLILLRPDLAGGLEEAELLFVLGRQCGHIHCQHTPLCTLLHAVERGLQPGWGWAGAPLKASLAAWVRGATLTADRAGLLACRDLDAALRGLATAHLGAACLDGARAAEELLATHTAPPGESGLMRRLRPLPLALRAEALRLFGRSALFRERVLGSQGGLPAAHLEERVARLLAGEAP